MRNLLEKSAFPCKRKGINARVEAMKRAVKALVDSRILGRALITGVVLEIAYFTCGHWRPVLDIHFGLFACMMIAGTAALLYARDLARGYVMGALGGLVIGAACG